MECKNAAFYLSCLNGFVSEQTRGRKQRPSSSSSSSSSAKMGVSERQLSVKKVRSNQRYECGVGACFFGLFPRKRCEWNDEVFPETNTESEESGPK
ncbi:hypothetical protein AAC387_Pa08g0209 [Persea americana]